MGNLGRMGYGARYGVSAHEHNQCLTIPSVSRRCCLIPIARATSVLCRTKRSHTALLRPILKATILQTVAPSHFCPANVFPPAPALLSHPGPKGPDGSFVGRGVPDIDVLEATIDTRRRLARSLRAHSGRHSTNNMRHSRPTKPCNSWSPILRR